jgi:glycosyltransferase involved in cell wall biosynthesis
VKQIGGTSVPAYNRTQTVRALADALQWCADHRESFSNATKQISEKASKEFGRERYIEQINEIYQRALAVNRTP